MYGSMMCWITSLSNRIQPSRFPLFTAKTNTNSINRITRPTDMQTETTHLRTFALPTHKPTLKVKSKLLWWFLKNTGDRLQGDARTFKTNNLSSFPLPLEISAKEQPPFIDLVDKIIAQKQNREDTKINEKKIDELVYILYDLTEEEIQIVEG